MAERIDTLLTRWQTRIAEARKLRSDWEKQYRVAELERAWLGIGALEESTDAPLRLNHFFATVQTKKPALLAMSTHFLVQPKRGKEPFGTVESRVQEGVLRAIAEQDNNLRLSARLAMAQAFFRLGVLKVAYTPRFEPNPQYDVEVEGREVPEGEAPPIQEPKEILTDEVYSFNWVDARRILFPDEGPDQRKWGWIAEEIEVSLEEAKADTRFRHRSQLVSNAQPEEGPGRGGARVPPDQDDDQESQRFCYVECWDIRHKMLYVWADGQDFEGFLMREAFPDGIEDHPYALLRFLPILGPEPSPWPKPLTYDWLSMQEEYDIQRTMQTNAARRAARKFLYEADTFPSDEELDKFTSNVDMQGVEITNASRPPIMFGETSLNLDVARQIPILRDDWRTITGSSGPRLGMPTGDTATEAMIVEQAASLRESEDRQVVDEWLAEAGQKMLQMVKQTLTLDLWIQLRGFNEQEFKEFLTSDSVQQMLAFQLGPENVPLFLAALEMNPQLQTHFRERFGTLKPLMVTRSALQFEADVKVLPSTSRPLQQASLLRLAQVIGPLAFMSPTFLDELLKSFDLPMGAQIAEEMVMYSRRMMEQQQGVPPTGRPTTSTRQPLFRRAG